MLLYIAISIVKIWDIFLKFFYVSIYIAVLTKKFLTIFLNFLNFYIIPLHLISNFFAFCQGIL